MSCARSGGLLVMGRTPITDEIVRTTRYILDQPGLEIVASRWKLGFLMGLLSDQGCADY